MRNAWRSGAGGERRLVRGVTVALAWALWLAPAAGQAAPVAVRAPEGPVYGILSLSSADGTTLAYGELTQQVREGIVESGLVFRFKDGSLYDEVVTFTQDKVFRVTAYRLIQRGPAFPHDMQVSFDRKSGRYAVRYREKASEPEERREGAIDLPPDLYNGMASVLARNLDGAKAEGHMLAFTPTPRLLRMEFLPSGEETYYVGSTQRTSTRYLITLELPGLIGLAASLIGKDPPDLTYWIARRPVPAFLKFEGAFFLNGPVWRVELFPARFSPPR